MLNITYTLKQLLEESNDVSLNVWCVQGTGDKTTIYCICHNKICYAFKSLLLISTLRTPLYITKNRKHSIKYESTYKAFSVVRRCMYKELVCLFVFNQREQ